MKELAGDPLRLTSLNHISLVCGSLDVSINFYESVLGFRWSMVYSLSWKKQSVFDQEMQLKFWSRRVQVIQFWDWNSSSAIWWITNLQDADSTSHESKGQSHFFPIKVSVYNLSFWYHIPIIQQICFWLTFSSLRKILYSARACQW